VQWLCKDLINPVVESFRGKMLSKIFFSELESE
jgi:hypothetical protein